MAGSDPSADHGPSDLLEQAKDMAGRRPPKQSDLFVVRVHHGLKDAFLEACRREGRTASAVIRSLMQERVDAASVRSRAEPPTARRPFAAILASPRSRLAVGAAAAASAFAAIALIAAPSAADLDLRGAFAALDADGDGQVTLGEFAAPGAADQSAVAVVRAMRQGADSLSRIGRTPGGVGVTEYWVPGAPSDWPIATEAPEPGDEEWAEELRLRSFAGFDTDGDQIVDWGEFEALHLRMIERTFRLLDADLDGRVTAAEFNKPIAYEFTAPAGTASPAAAALSEAAFLRLGHDRDGAISAAEFELGPQG